MSIPTHVAIIMDGNGRWAAQRGLPRVKGHKEGVRTVEAILEAASDLGSSTFNSFWKITVPLSKNGIIAGCMLVFIPVVGEFVIPELLGGPETLMIGKVLWQEFFNNRDWPVASAVAVVMLMILMVPIIWFYRYQRREMQESAS